MKYYKKNKRGFTLIEIMLAIAIICLIGGLFVELIYATTESYYRSYNQNDATDYAQLYAKAIENNVLRDCDLAPDGPHTFRIEDDPAGVPYLLCHDSTDVFAGKLAQIVNENGVAKWRIYIGNVNYTSEGMFTYTIYMVDNYRNPGTLVLEYDAGFWIPQDKYGNGKVYTVTPGSTSTFTYRTRSDDPSTERTVAYNQGFTLDIATN